MKRKILTMLICLALLLSVAVPCFAFQTEEYSYNGIVLPQLPVVEGMNYALIGQYDGGYCVCFSSTAREVVLASKKLTISTSSSNGYMGYILTEGEWVKMGANSKSCVPIWANYDVLYSSDKSIILPASDVVVSVIDNTIDFDDFSGVFSSVAEQFSAQSAVEVLVLGASAVVGLVFFWWGARKLTRAVMGAFKKGRVNL